uniref:Uncharacterized protein n=1 Tax=Timema monikensis TaxID=170555 RepID=A0A7R9HL21_9NEOP|nr:unnamed protein product [Timema monikensis]
MTRRAKFQSLPGTWMVGFSVVVTYTHSRTSFAPGLIKWTSWRVLCALTQLISTHLGRLVLGSITLQKAYIILPLFRSSVSSSTPPAEKSTITWKQKCAHICMKGEWKITLSTPDQDITLISL